MNAPTNPPTALIEFLCQVERRGIVLAELQCGHRETGEIALAACLRAFGVYASEDPKDTWPRSFWSLLATSSALRQVHPEALWKPETDVLADLANDDRLALLLRLVAGLDEDEAAKVMGLDQKGYRAALARACPRDDSGEPDPEGWRKLAEAIQTHLHDLPPDRLEHLSRLRETLFPNVVGTPISEEQVSEVESQPNRTVPRRPSALRITMIFLLIVCVLTGLGVGWWWYTH